MPAKRNFDTVEEFWALDDVHQAYELAGSNSVESFEDELASWIGCSKAYSTPSARWGLQWVLENIPQKCGTYVLALAFNCSVVENAILSAGYKLKLYDFRQSPGCYDWEQVADKIDKDCVAIVIPHLFGVPTDFREIIELCKDNQVLIIEDCAHTLGGYIADQHVGTLGDACIFSFNYDKPISLGWGGALVLNYQILQKAFTAPLFSVPRKEWEYSKMQKFCQAMSIRRKNISHTQSFMKKILQKAGLLTRVGFQMPQNESIGPLRAELGRLALQRYPKVLNKRCQKEEILRDKAKEYFTWPVDSYVKPAWLKQKICLKKAEDGIKCSKILQKNGYRVGNFNWPRLMQGDGAEKCLISKQAANFWLDVPVHQNLPDNDIQYISDIFNSI